MTIQIGDKIPDASFLTMSTSGPQKISDDELFSGKRVVLFAVPGAFTPTCHASHLPGYLENIDALKERGVDQVAVVSVNDVHVMGHWARATGGKDKILFLADGNGDFAKSLGMDVDLSIGGMGIRSKRYSMIIDNGVVQALNVEEKRGVAEISSAATILKQL